MPNKDGTGNVLDGLRNIGLAIVSFGPMVAVGILAPSLWAMPLLGAAGGALLGKVATKGSWKDIGGWAAIGALAGLGFYIAV